MHQSLQEITEDITVAPEDGLEATSCCEVMIGSTAPLPQ